MFVREGAKVVVGAVRSFLLLPLSVIALPSPVLQLTPPAKQV
jgi:hypothetical protein